MIRTRKCQLHKPKRYATKNTKIEHWFEPLPVEPSGALENKVTGLILVNAKELPTSSQKCHIHEGASSGGNLMLLHTSNIGVESLNRSTV